MNFTCEAGGCRRTTGLAKKSALKELKALKAPFSCQSSRVRVIRSRTVTSGVVFSKLSKLLNQ